jgi:periplasmic divalent cation tolerance protein
MKLELQDFIVVLTTVENEEQATLLARHLVESHLAACVQVMPRMTSVYRWKENIEEAREHLLIIKTTSSNYAELEAEIRAEHPYEIPEIIALPVVSGSTDYLLWLEESILAGTAT